MLTRARLNDLALAAFLVADAAATDAAYLADPAEQEMLLAFAGRARALAVEAAQRGLNLPLATPAGRHG